MKEMVFQKCWGLHLHSYYPDTDFLTFYLILLNCNFHVFLSVWFVLMSFFGCFTHKLKYGYKLVMMHWQCSKWSCGLTKPFYCILSFLLLCFPFSLTIFFSIFFLIYPSFSAYTFDSSRFFFRFCGMRFELLSLQAKQLNDLFECV